MPSRPVAMETPTIGGMLVAGRPEVVEVEVAGLVEAMRSVAADPGRAAGVGVAASRRIREEHTWDRTAAVAAARLQALAA